MVDSWRGEDVDRMAPDASSIAAGRKLAQARQWLRLGSSATHLWGELKGSGANPYQTCIELAGPAFHCSCPSRKIPCKHVLGLAYLYAESPAALTADAPPEWVEEWLRKRAEREERKQARAESAAQPPDAQTAARRSKEQERRSRARFDKAAAGIAFVSQWLHDALRHGLASVAEQPYRYWDELAARTVDAQIPGLARHFRHLSALPHGRAQWQGPFLDRIAHLNLLCTAFEKYEALASEWRADIEAALGFSQSREELAATESVSDRWCLLGTAAGEEDGLRYQRTWLHGQHTGRSALLLDFAARSQVLPHHGPPGSCFDAELIFYPSAWPQRAFFRQRGESQPDGQLPEGFARLAEAQEHYVAAVAQLPWLERVAVTLTAVTPLLVEGAWYLVDGAGEALPLDPECRNGWELLAMSGGQAVTLVCEFDGETLSPLSLADAEGLRSLPAGSGRIATEPPAIPYPLWQQALTAALLGSDRQQQVLNASGPLGAALEHLYPNGALPGDGEARSQALLRALSLLSLYRKAAQPPRRELPQPAPCPADSVPEAAALAAGHLRQLLDSRDVTLLTEWLELAAVYNVRCPAPLVPALLDAAVASKELQPHLKPALGMRGRWLAELQEPWRTVLTRHHYDAEEDVLRRWEEGRSDERCAALQWLRRVQPAAARERLIAVFANEAAAVRAALLATLHVNLGSDDAQFLQSCLADKSQEVRRRAAELLSLLPEASFTLRLQERAHRWLSYESKSGLLGRLGARKGAIVVTLPEAWDAALLGEGLVEKPPRGKGAKAWWLEQTLSLVAPCHWETQWSLTPAECLALLDGHEWRDALLAGWLNATLLHHDAAWARALLGVARHLNIDAATRQQLWQHLMTEAREELAAQIFASRQAEAIGDAIEALLQLEERWSETLSRQVIDALHALIERSRKALDYRSQALLRGAASALAASQFDYFERRFAREWEDETPWKKTLDEVRARLGFRAAMRAALSE